MKRWPLIAGLAVCAAFGTAAPFLMQSKDMPLEEAMALVGKDLSPSQRKVVTATIRRRAIKAVMLLREIAIEDTPAGVEAKAALDQLLSEITR